MCFEISPTPQVLAAALKHFSEVYLLKISQNKLCDSDLICLYKKYTKEILENLCQSRTKKSPFPLPFYGHVVEDWCKGIKKNLRLYTQCERRPSSGEEYCKICARQAANNSTSLPSCGDIRTRKSRWNKELNYKPDGMKKEIPYANLVDKLQLTWSEVDRVVELLGWPSIPDCHRTIKKARRGRPAKTKVAVSDSDEDVPKKKRGRPKKPKKNEMSDEDLIAALCGEI